MGGKYIEALMAATLLAILIIPITMTIQLGARNSSFSSMRYDSVILADSLLIEISNSLFLMENPRQEIQSIHNNGALIKNLLGITYSNFNDRYKADTFNYFARIDGYNFLTGEIKLGYSFTCENIGNEYSEINYNFWIYISNNDLPLENLAVIYNEEGAILTVVSSKKEVLQLMITVEIHDKYYNILNTVFRPIMIY